MLLPVLCQLVDDKSHSALGVLVAVHNNGTRSLFVQCWCPITLLGTQLGITINRKITYLFPQGTCNVLSKISTLNYINQYYVNIDDDAELKACTKQQSQ